MKEFKVNLDSKGIMSASFDGTNNAALIFTNDNRMSIAQVLQTYFCGPWDVQVKMEDGIIVIYNNDSVYLSENPEKLRQFTTILYERFIGENARKYNSIFAPI